MPTDIGVEEAQRLILEDEALLLEVLPRDEYTEEHIAGATNIPLKELSLDSVSGIDRDRAVVVYCDDDL
jgi:rhodanese-related sulfurtransferase